VKTFRDEQSRAGATGERWAAEIRARAAAHWTAERTRGQLGDKELIFSPVEAAPLLRAIGLLRGDASMSPASVRKYMQVSHMVALLEPALLDLAASYPVVRILDAGCGSSSLTLLLAWCFKHRWCHPAQILGIDRDDRVIATCRRRALLTSLDDVLAFEAAALDGLDLGAAWSQAFGEPPDEHLLHALVALHACDTATDAALAAGVAWSADLLAAAPCCQAELARGWAELAEGAGSGPLAPVWGSPHLRREAAATMTDALRLLLLQGCGYEVTAMEFVPSAHTPKNTLLRAFRRGRPSREPFERYVALCRALGGPGIRLAAILPDGHRARLGEIEGAAGRHAEPHE
jgi:SAM-dependent methyltransferase